MTKPIAPSGNGKETSPASAGKRGVTALRPLPLLLLSLLLALLPVVLYSLWKYESTAAFLERSNYRALGSLARHLSNRINNVAEVLQLSPCTCPAATCTLEPNEDLHTCTEGEVEARVQRALSAVPGLEGDWRGAVCGRASGSPPARASSPPGAPPKAWPGGPSYGRGERRHKDAAGCDPPEGGARRLRIRDGGPSPTLMLQVPAAHWCTMPAASPAQSGAALEGRACKLPDGDKRYWIRARAKLSAFVGELDTGRQIFDHLLIVAEPDSKVDDADQARRADPDGRRPGSVEGETSGDVPSGRLLWQLGDTGPVAVDFQNLKVLRAGEPKMLASLPQAAGGALVELWGDEYHLYRQPLQLTWSDDARRPIRWTLYGLVGHSALRARALNIPLGYAAGLALLALAGMLGWPLSKLLLVGPFDRLRSLDVWALMWGTPLLIGAVTLFALTMVDLGNLEHRRDDDLAAVGDQVQGQLTEELTTAAGLARDLGPRVDGLVIASALRHVESRSPRAPCPEGHPPTAARLSEPGRVDTIVAMDSGGRQIGKSTVGRTSTPLGRHEDRSYFARALRLPPCGDAFVVAPVLTRSRGQNMTMVAVRGANAECSTEEDASEQGAGSCARVNVAGIEPLAVTAPILPVGYQFLVLDRKGSVKYRSRGSSLLEENAFDESDPPGNLESSIGAGQGVTFDLTYHGVEYRAHARPLSLAGHDWSLVVYQDDQVLGTIITHLLAIGTLCLMFLGIAYATVFLLQARLRLTPGGWLWFCPDRFPHYLCAISLQAVAVAAFVVVTRSGVSTPCPLTTTCVWSLTVLAATRLVVESGASAWRSTVDAAAVVLGGSCLCWLAGWNAGVAGSVVLVCAVIALARNWPKRWVPPSEAVWSSKASRAAYAACGMLLLGCVGVLPGVVIHADASDHQVGSLARWATLEYVKDWQRRERRLQVASAELEGLPVGDRPPTGPSTKTAPSAGSQTKGVYVARSLLAEHEPEGEAEPRISQRRHALEPASTTTSDPECRLELPLHTGSPLIRWIVKQLPIHSWPARELNSVWRGVDGAAAPRYVDIPEPACAVARASWDQADPAESGLVQTLLRVLAAFLGFGALGVLVLLLGRRVYGLQWYPVQRRQLSAPPPEVGSPVAADGALELRLGWDTQASCTRSFILDARCPRAIASAREHVRWRGYWRLDVRHLEACLMHRAQRRQMLSLLERAAFHADRERRAIRIQSELNPMRVLVERPLEHWFTSGDKEDELVRWGRVLVEFEHTGSVGRARLADAEHWTQWSSCTALDRSVLVHLARDGLVNPDAWSIARRLEARRLLEYGPPYTISGPAGFRDFLHTPLLHQEAEHDARATGSPWRSMRVPLMLMVTALMALLAVREPDIFLTQAGVLTAVVSSLATVARLIDTVRNRAGNA